MPITGTKQPAKQPAAASKKTVSKTNGESKKTHHRRRRQSNSYSSYIYKVLKQVHPDTGISKKAMIVMDNFM
jgi:hypothetical protein